MIFIGKSSDFDWSSRMATSLGASAFVLAVTLVASARAGEHVRVPAYKPPIGKEILYRVTVTATVELGQNSNGTLEGEYPNRMTVLAKLPGGFRVAWHVSADPLDGTMAARAPALNRHYGDTLRAYGANSITLETDKAGKARVLLEADAIHAKIQGEITQALGPEPHPEDKALDPVLQLMKREPLMPVYAIAPAALFLPQHQLPSAKNIEIGPIKTTHGGVPVGEASAPSTVQWRAESWNKAARTITYLQTVKLDEAELTRLFKARIDAFLADEKSKQGDLPAERIAEYSSARSERSTHATVSLDDGAAVLVEDVSIMRIGPLFTRTVTRISREK
jgi:hypothetical protein